MATYLGEKLHTNVQLPAILPGARGAALLWQGAAAATGLVLGAGQVYGGAAPFGLAFTMLCPPLYLFAAAGGVLISSLAFQPAVLGVKVIAALTATVAVRRLLQDKPNTKNAGIWAGCLALALAQAAVLFFAGGYVDLSQAAATGTTALLAAGSAWLMRRFPYREPRGLCLWLAIAAACLQRCARGPLAPGLAVAAAAGLCAAFAGTLEETAVVSITLAAAITASGPTLAFAALAVCFIAGVATGTWCGFGANDIAVLCPVGALLSMVAAKTLIPRAVLSIVVAIALVLLLGRLFCGWICPVTLWRRVKEFFKPVKTREQEVEALSQANQALAAEEIAALKEASATHDCAACGACHAKRNAPFDSRHAVLGGALLTTAVFGFPVFCLVCPVGLTFAAVALLVSLFGAGDLNWSLLFVPAMLVIELVFLRKWCGRFCPISAFMSLFSRFSRTGMPVIDNERCLETAKGTACSRCATACTFDVNLRHPDLGELPLHDCARCGDCIEACPTSAIAFRVVSGKPVPFANALSSVRGGGKAKTSAAPALDDLEPEEA